MRKYLSPFRHVVSSVHTLHRPLLTCRIKQYSAPLVVAHRASVNIAIRAYATEAPRPSNGDEKTEKDVEDKEDKGTASPYHKGFEHFFKPGQSATADKEAGAKNDGKEESEKKAADEDVPDPEKPNSSNTKRQAPQPGSMGGGGGNPTFGQVIMGTILVMGVWRVLLPPDSTREITWQEFRTAFLDRGVVEKLTVVNRSRVRVALRPEKSSSSMGDSTDSGARQTVFYFSIGSVEAFERRLDEAQRELSIPSAQRIPVAYHEEMSLVNTFLSFLPTLLLIGAVYWFSKRGMSSGGANPFGIGRSKAKLYNQETEIKINFRDVAGMDEAKEEVMEFVKFLKEPGRFEKLGAKIPRGAILSGPPGTGKTLLAKATAGEAGVPFLSVSGSEFVEMFVGVGASRVRDLFARARKDAPCIIFVDEIDAIGKARARGGVMGGNDERETTLNQLLVEMDGFSTSEHVVVLAGTNRPDVLDPALLRPGRFDRHITIDRPDLEGRKQIFMVHLKRIKTEVNLKDLADRLAVLTPGFSGADIANCANESALIAARYHAKSVELVHFEQAIERVIAGLEKKSRVLSKEEKNTVAHHEAGHAVAGWFLKFVDPLLKVSIIPRAQALGYASYLPKDQYLVSKGEILDRMSMALAGRVSEEIFFGEEAVTSGASDDFQKVTRLAQAYVTSYGMSESVGTISYPMSDDRFSKPFSEATAKLIDEEVRNIVSRAHKRTLDLLLAHKEGLIKVADRLLTKEVITYQEVEELLGPRPFPDKHLDLSIFKKNLESNLPETTV